MKKFESVIEPLMWSMALLLVGLAAGCGGNGGGDPILGGGGGGVGAGAGAGAGIIPGAACSVASGVGIPTVLSSDPTNGNSAVPTTTAGVANSGKLILANFSMAMNPATISSPASTFTLATSGVTVAGSVTMNPANTVAILTTSGALSTNTLYTAIITTGAQSAASAPLACPYQWSFTTAAASGVGQAPIDLGRAKTFGIAGRAGMTSTGVTVVNGNVALTPLGTCTDSTGGPGSSSQSCMFEAYGAHATGLTVNGSIRFPTDSDAGATALAVMTDLTAAWTEGFNKADTMAGVLVGELGGPGPVGKTIIPGVYNEANLGFALNGVATFDAQNNADAIFIIKVGTIGGTGDFTDSGTLLSPNQIKLANGAQAKNIWFVVGRDVVIGSGTTWNGNILAGRTVTIDAGTTVLGRVLSGASGAVGGIFTLTATTGPTSITVPAP